LHCASSLPTDEHVQAASRYTNTTTHLQRVLVAALDAVEGVAVGIVGAVVLGGVLFAHGGERWGVEGGAPGGGCASGGVGEQNNTKKRDCAPAAASPVNSELTRSGNFTSNSLRAFMTCVVCVRVRGRGSKAHEGSTQHAAQGGTAGTASCLQTRIPTHPHCHVHVVTVCDARAKRRRWVPGGGCEQTARGPRTGKQRAWQMVAVMNRSIPHPALAVPNHTYMPHDAAAVPATSPYSFCIVAGVEGAGGLMRGWIDRSLLRH